MPITADEVLWAFRYFLGREPEAASVPALMASYENREAIRRDFAKSLEFRLTVATETKKRYAIAPFLLPAPVGEELRLGLPSLATPTSQLCTHGQMQEQIFADCCSALGIYVRVPHRKQWEWAYIARALDYFEAIKPNARGLGFGVGTEPVSSMLAARGAIVVATDSPDATWTAGNQYAAELRSIWKKDLVAWETFENQVRLRKVDMNAIDDDLRGFDFVWSSCSLEHLGSLRHGSDFVINAMRCLRRGGIAIHTTEFNLSSNEETMETPGLSIYRRRDIDELCAELAADGHAVEPVNYFPGCDPLDEHIDLPPYSLPHLKLDLAGIAATSIGIIVRKG